VEKGGTRNWVVFELLFGERKEFDIEFGTCGPEMWDSKVVTAAIAVAMKQCHDTTITCCDNLSPKFGREVNDEQKAGLANVGYERDLG